MDRGRVKMDAAYLSLLVFGLVVLVRGENGTIETSTIKSSTVGDSGTTVPNTTMDTTSEATTEIAHRIEVLGFRGLYGGTYYNSAAENRLNYHYIHGYHQPPEKDYYRSRKYYRDHGTDETLDYYLGFAISKMTDDNFEYHDFHHYYHNINRTISKKETIPSEFVIACHPNATFLCPENTETICLLNGTIYCMSRISAVVPCPQNETDGCVNTVVPCVQQCIAVSYNFEGIVLPCLSTVEIVDVYEDNKGKTLGKVGGTFIILDALKQAERTFCVTVIVDPKLK